MECYKCGRTETARWYDKSTDKPFCCSCYRKEYVAKNRDKALAAQKKANASETSRKARKEYANTSKGRAIIRASQRKRNKETNRSSKKYHANKGYYREYSNCRLRRLDKASLGQQYKSETVEIYNKCPMGMHVDHMIPIKGHDYINGIRQHVVCGLHVPWNLQYLTPFENLSKSCNLYSLEDLP